MGSEALTTKRFERRCGREVGMIILPFILALQNPAPPICDPPGEYRTYTYAHQQETRERVQKVCKRVGASPHICAFMDAIVVRESAGRAGVRHTLGTVGRGENGLGAMGLSIPWHSNKWTGDADPDFCIPEVSAVVTLAIFRRAVKRYNAGNVLEIQAIFGGQWEHKHGKAWPRPTSRTVGSICSRMRRRDYSCYDRVDLKDLGRNIRLNERQSFVDSLME